MFGFRRTAALAAVLLAWPLAAGAQTPNPAISKACDGYGAWTKRNDGMELERDWFGGLPNATIKRGEARLGRPALNACDAALSILPEQYWRRKISLLHARAINHLAYQEPEAALADLDLAEAAALEPADPYYVRSQGLGGKLIRAFALRRTGKQEQATDLAVEAWLARPYNRPMARAVLASMGPMADPDRAEIVLRGIARLSPALSAELFWRAMEARRFDEAIMFYRSMTPRRTYPDEPATRLTRELSELENQAKAELFWASNAGPYAYALAATGKPEEARAALAQARVRLDRAVETLAHSNPADKEDPLKIADRSHRSGNLKRDGGEALDEWTRIVERRIDAAGDKAGEVLMSLTKDRVPNSPIMIDFVDALLAHLPEDMKEAAPALEDLKAKLESKAPEENAGQDITDLFNNLPDPESPNRLTSYGKKEGFWSGAANAYRMDQAPDGKATVTFTGNAGSQAMIEELALLYAADHALRAGKSGLIVISRRDFEHVLTMSSFYGAAGEEFPTGADSRLEVLFVDPNALPPGYEHAGWRVIDAREVYNTLGPIYGAPVQPGGG